MRSSFFLVIIIVLSQKIDCTSSYSSTQSRKYDMLYGGSKTSSPSSHGLLVISAFPGVQDSKVGLEKFRLVHHLLFPPILDFSCLLVSFIF